MELSLPQLIAFSMLNLSTLLIGYRFVRHSMIYQSWVLLVLNTLCIHFIFLNDYAIIRMLALIATAFTAMKIIVTAETYKEGPFKLSFFQWCIFVVGWAGMRPKPFEKLGEGALPHAWRKIKFGVSRMLFGLLLVVLAHRLMRAQIDRDILHFIITAILLVAFSLILHFGWLSISAGVWRLFGVNTDYLFKAPAKAKTLNEFWSKRWNLAFSEMTSVALFRPLKDKASHAIAFLIAFLFSGMLHELALSVSIQKGYGLPLLYFVIQGIVVLIEQSLLRREVHVLQLKIFGRLWVCFWLTAPLPLLFNHNVIQEIIWPMAGLYTN